MKQFISKKNKVFLEDGLVFKHCADSTAAKKEAESLTCLASAGVWVPKVMKVSENTIVMEYIVGETIPEFLNRMEFVADEQQIFDAAQRLCSWLILYYDAVKHSRTNENRGDVNGRNFILTYNHVVSVDFEEHSFGSREQDVGKMCAFICMYDPAHTDVKRNFSKMFMQAAVEQMKLDEHIICDFYCREIDAMKVRRKK